MRVAPIDQHGLRTISVLPAPAGGALLDAIAPGPRGEAVVLWTAIASTPPAAPSALAMAARGLAQPGGVMAFGAPETLGPAAPAAAGSLAVGPGDDRAVAAWRAPDGTLEYAVRAPGTGG